MYRISEIKGLEIKNLQTEETFELKNIQNSSLKLEIDKEVYENRNYLQSIGGSFTIKLDVDMSQLDNLIKLFRLDDIDLPDNYNIS